MTIKVLFFAELKELFGQSRFIDAKEDATILEVVNSLATETSALHSKKDILIYAVNENFETDDTVLKNNDELALMTPMSGG